MADDPDLGRPSGPPGVLTVTVDGELFEDCPALAIGYIRESDRIEIRYMAPAPSAGHAADAQDQQPDRDRCAGPAADAPDRLTG
ncbi:hypothetical protein ACFV0C_18155 [Streptomyces sp. NPDC059568]|uniref:hypothetical protein n=1 Tax=unclassified Streptomyces TaxID=2593676 RepID=UPI003665F8D6